MGFEGKKDNYPGYSIWGVAITEVEVDILTGEMYIVRSDVLEDAGLSTSPIVDIGQIEGAFGMGLGLWTSEEVKHNPETGALLTMNTYIGIGILALAYWHWHIGIGILALA